MNARNYYSIFKHEPDILTVPDVVRLLRMGKNTVYKLIKEGSINSIKQGKKNYHSQGVPCRVFA